MMVSQLQSEILEKQKFMCLEDRLLQALYKQEGPTSLQSLAAPISITPTAALSIAHRIKKTYPQYLVLTEDGGIDMCIVAPVQAQVSKVAQFLDKGGFTKLNEQEFVLYYEKELKREKREAFIRLYKAKMKREKWAIGIGSLVGLGIIFATYLYKQKKYFGS